jgi:hypothetical protein
MDPGMVVCGHSQTGAVIYHGSNSEEHHFEGCSRQLVFINCRYTEESDCYSEDRIVRLTVKLTARSLPQTGTPVTAVADMWHL